MQIQKDPLDSRIFREILIPGNFKIGTGLYQNLSVDKFGQFEQFAGIKANSGTTRRETGACRPWSAMMKVGIIGLGIGGATAAATLARHGVDFRVFEQASEIREVGAGVATWPNTVRLLKRLGIGPQLARIGCPVVDYPIRRSDGSIIHEVLTGTYDDTTGYYFHRAELLEAIASLIPSDRVTLNKRCRHVAQAGDKVIVEFEDGHSDEFDVVLGADGIRSVVISAVTSATPPIYSNLAAYRGLVSNEGEGILDRGHLWTDRKKYFVAFPVSGGHLVNFVGVVPTDGRPEESWFRKGAKPDLEHEYKDWDPVVRSIISKVETTFRWGLYFRHPLPNVVNQRIALLGDAAHPMLIHAGQGVAMALEDGVALGTLLARATQKNVVERLSLYQKLRLTRATAVQTLSRRNAQFMHEVFPLDLGVERPQQASDVSWILNYDVEREALALLA